jgi:hypothetical protein
MNRHLWISIRSIWCTSCPSFDIDTLNMVYFRAILCHTLRCR